MKPTQQAAISPERCQFLLSLTDAEKVAPLVGVYLYILGFRTQVRALAAQRELVAFARRELTAHLTCHGDLYQIAAPAIWQSR